MFDNYVYMYIICPGSIVSHFALSPILLWNFSRCRSFLHLELGMSNFEQEQCHLKDVFIIKVSGIVQQGMALSIKLKKKKLKGQC